MSMTRNYGETPLTLSELVIAAYTPSTDTIGTAVTLPSQMKLEISFEADNAVIKSGGADRHGVSVVTGATFALSAAGIPWDAMATLCGWTLASPSAGIETLQGDVAGSGMPYFVIAGKHPDSIAGDVHVGIVACKLDAPPAWKINENNEFLVSEMEGRVFVPTTRKLPYVRKQTTATAISLTTLFA